jgi:hypothetical protein
MLIRLEHRKDFAVTSSKLVLIPFVGNSSSSGGDGGGGAAAATTTTTTTSSISSSSSSLGLFILYEDFVIFLSPAQCYVLYQKTLQTSDQHFCFIFRRPKVQKSAWRLAILTEIILFFFFPVFLSRYWDNTLK